MADITSRHRVSFHRPGRDQLNLVDLTGEPLKNLGLNNDMSGGDDYTIPQLWAAAIHAQDPSWDGICYVSRQNNDRRAYAFFDRSGVTVAKARPLADGEIADLCDHFEVSVI
jgi:hypothetical protein